MTICRRKKHVLPIEQGDSGLADLKLDLSLDCSLRISSGNVKLEKLKKADILFREITRFCMIILLPISKTDCCRGDADNAISLE